MESIIRCFLKNIRNKFLDGETWIKVIFVVVDKNSVYFGRILSYTFFIYIWVYTAVAVMVSLNIRICISDPPYDSMTHWICQLFYE